MANKHVVIFTILITSLCGIISCHPHGRNKSLLRPDMPVYVLNTVSDSISIIDGKRDEWYKTFRLPDIGDTFFVRPDGTIAVPIRGRLERPKKEVAFFSPDNLKKVGELEVMYPPFNGNVRDNRIGVMIHNNILEGGMSPISIVDLEKKKVIAIFQFPGISTGIGFKDNQVLVYTAGLPEKAVRQVRSGFKDNQVLAATVGEPHLGYDPAIYQIDLDTLSVTKMVSLTKDQGFGNLIFYKDKAYGIRSSYHVMDKDDPLNHTLWVIDLTSKKVERMIKLQKENPYNLAVVEDKLYVSHYNIGNPSRPEKWVTIIDMNSYEIKNTIEVGEGPQGICYSKSLGKVYTANAEDNSVTVIDVQTEKVIKTLYTDQTRPRVIRCPE